MRTRWLVALILAVGCGRSDRSATDQGPLIVYAAGSLTRPLKAALDSFAVAEHATYQLESAGSLETARKLTELGKIPDVIALADVEVFPQLLVPTFTTWYAIFATNRLVLAKSPRAKFGNEINGDNWWSVLQRPGVETGRADPAVDPAGYRTLLVFQLAEQQLGEPGLAKALEAASPKRNVRPKSAELTALVQAGEFDYAWEYESVVRAAGLEFVRLPESIDLSSEADSLRYATATIRLPGKTLSDSITITATPIRYALSIPVDAAHQELAIRFVRYLMSPSGRRVLRAEQLQALDDFGWQGVGIPTELKGIPVR